MNCVEMTIINPRKGIDRGGDETSDLLFSSPARYRLSYTGPEPILSDHMNIDFIHAIPDGPDCQRISLQVHYRRVHFMVITSM